MNYNLIFSLANLGVLPFWVLMIFVPRWSWAVRIVRSPWSAIVPLVLQFGLSLFNAFASVEGVMRLLGTPQGTVIGWAHFLAFDLLVGRSAYLDAYERRVSSLIMAPVVFFILMLGPLGFVIYLAVHTVHTLTAGRNQRLQAV